MEAVMNNRRNGFIRRFSIADAAKARVTGYLDEVFAGTDSVLSDLNPWTQNLIRSEMMAKVALVFEADDPAEVCYRDLIREIDTEAQAGIFIARQGSPHGHLSAVVEERGVSGRLCQEIDVIAPFVFADEAAHSAEDLDLVWVTIEALHDRAHLDATVSELIMSHLLDDADAARDMSNAMRSLLYAFHEDVVRRRCDLPRVLDERERRDIEIMVGEFIVRSGNYESRIDEIRHRAESGVRHGTDPGHFAAAGAGRLN
jgi:hypothetical protein